MENVVALLQEANSDSAALRFDLNSADRERSELRTELSLQIYYVQRVNLSANMTFTALHPPGCLTCLIANPHVHVCQHNHYKHV